TAWKVPLVAPVTPESEDLPSPREVEWRACRPHHHRSCGRHGRPYSTRTKRAHFLFDDSGRLFV
ncbi:MAG: hypothetical protein ACR2MW_11420, partial [Chthoniobacterales bacterium]